MRNWHPILLLISILFISTSLAIGQKSKISLDDIYKDYIFNAKSVHGINSMNDGNHYTVNHKGTCINKYSYANGDLIETLFNAEDFATIQSFDSYEFSLDEQFILLTTETESIYRRSFLATYYIYNVHTKKLNPLSPNGKQQLASISPNNKTVAFVRENNIYLVDLESMVEMQLTYDGKKNEIINGAPDWVYEEEFGFADGFKWSQDGSKLAFYRFDESNVKQFFMSMYGELYPELYEFKYPKAGEQNSNISILVYDMNQGMTIEMDIPGEEDFYIPRIKWTNDSDILSIIWLNRLQNHVKILHCDATTGFTELVYEETNDKYISEATDNMITYLPDTESFLLISERDK